MPKAQTKPGGSRASMCFAVDLHLQCKSIKHSKNKTFPKKEPSKTAETTDSVSLEKSWLLVYFYRLHFDVM